MILSSCQYFILSFSFWPFWQVCRSTTFDFLKLLLNYFPLTEKLKSEIAGNRAKEKPTSSCKVRPKNPGTRFPGGKSKHTGREGEISVSSGSGSPSPRSSLPWAVLLKDSNGLGEEAKARIWLMGSSGNWAPKATETANSLPVTTPLSPLQVNKPHVWVSWDDPSFPEVQLPCSVLLPFLGIDLPPLISREKVSFSWMALSMAPR